jgi:zinc-binding alcohol dehydrogenase family protein
MTMRAVGYRENLDVGDPASLVDVTMPVPVPGPHDLLVRVRAVSVNPIDTKIRRGSPVAGGAVRILGFDAAGTVEAIGPEVTRFGVGDDVYYAGVTNRPGSNAEFQVVDEHIVGRKPATLDFAQSAALPLTTITAWEGLFDHLGLTPDSSGTLVAVAAAGGVGSMVTQLARTQTGLTVIATASRPESARFAAALGAHHVVNHHNGLAGHVLAIAPDGVDHVFSPYSPQHIDAYARALRPLGHVVCIDAAPDLGPIRHKGITWHSRSDGCRCSSNAAATWPVACCSCHEQANANAEPIPWRCSRRLSGGSGRGVGVLHGGRERLGALLRRRRIHPHDLPAVAVEVEEAA